MAAVIAAPSGSKPNSTLRRPLTAATAPSVDEPVSGLPWREKVGFRLLSGTNDLTRYLFNTRKNQHYFCKHCGVRAFGIGTETPIGKMYGINLGCLTDVSDEELSRLPITYVDGRNDRWQSPPDFFVHL